MTSLILITEGDSPIKVVLFSALPDLLLSTTALRFDASTRFFSLIVISSGSKGFTT